MSRYDNKSEESSVILDRAASAGGKARIFMSCVPIWSNPFDPCEMAKKTIEEYADGPEGLTMGECLDIGFTDEECENLTGVLQKGKEGAITVFEIVWLYNSGFEYEFVKCLKGEDGGDALRARVKWLGDNIKTKIWRLDYGVLDRLDMVSELASIKDEGSINDFIDAALDCSDDNLIRSNAMAAIMNINSGIAIPVFIQKLIEGNVCEKGAAAWTLGIIGGKEAVQALITTLLSSEDPYLRYCVILSIGRIRDKDAVHALLVTMMNEEEDIHNRCQAVVALGMIGDKVALNAINGLIANRETPQELLNAARSCLSQKVFYDF